MTWNAGHGVSCSVPAALLINGAVENSSQFIFVFPEDLGAGVPQGDAFSFVSTEYSTLTWTGCLSLQQVQEESEPDCSSPG